MRTFLSAYAIRIKKKGERTHQATLSNFDGLNDLQNVIELFLNDLSTNFTNKTYKTYLKASHHESIGRVIHGVFESGSYGLSSNIRDVETDSDRYKKTSKDADLLPFYFLIYIPKDTDEGILILQRTGKHGIREIFGVFLNKYFLDKYKKYRVEINPLVQDELIKRILRNGTIKKVHCVKYKAHVDVFDKLEDLHRETSFDMEVAFSGKNIPFHNILEDLFASKKDIKSLVELNDYNFSYDTVKLDVETNKTIKTFDLCDLKKVRTYYDISDAVDFDSDNHPNFQSIQGVAMKYRDEIIQQVYP